MIGKRCGTLKTACIGFTLSQFVVLNNDNFMRANVFRIIENEFVFAVSAADICFEQSRYTVDDLMCFAAHL